MIAYFSSPVRSVRKTKPQRFYVPCLFYMLSEKSLAVQCCEVQSPVLTDFLFGLIPSCLALLLRVPRAKPKLRQSLVKHMSWFLSHHDKGVRSCLLFRIFFFTQPFAPSFARE